jgi:hypothetical protein
MAMIMILNEDFRTPRRRSQLARAWINRNKAESHAKIMRDYFNPDVTYTDKQFRRRFRMQKDLFLTITTTMEDYGWWL